MAAEIIALPGKGWKKNSGQQPKSTRGKRVRVILAHGEEPIYADKWNNMLKPGWGADSARWTITEDERDIVWYLTL